MSKPIAGQYLRVLAPFGVYEGDNAGVTAPRMTTRVIACTAAYGSGGTMIQQEITLTIAGTTLTSAPMDFDVAYDTFTALCVTHKAELDDVAAHPVSMRARSTDAVLELRYVR